MNLNLAIDYNAFKPYDYLGTSLGLLDRYNQEYEKNQAVYDKIAQTLGTLASAVEGSTDAKRMYDQYNEDFQKAAESFANGMTSINARDLAKLRTRYGTDIQRLEQARQAMAKVADLRRQMSASGKGDDYLYEDMGNLDTYLKNPNYNPRAYNGLEIRKMAADMASKLGQTIYNIANGTPLDAYTNTYLEQSGIDNRQLQDLVSKVNQGYTLDQLTEYPAFNNIIKLAIGPSGVMDWGDRDSQSKALQQAVQGLYAGLGTVKGHTYNNFYNQKMLEAQIAAYQQALKADKSSTDARDLPIMYSETALQGAGEDADKVRKSAMEKLGIKQQLKTGQTTYGKIKLDGYLNLSPNQTHWDPTGYTSYSEYMSKNSIPNDIRGKEYRVFDSKGYLLSKDNFIAQGTSKEEKSILEKYYNEAIIPSIKSINASGTRHVNNLYKKGQEYVDKGGASYISTIDLPMKMSYSDKRNWLLNFTSNYPVYKVEGNLDKLKDISYKDFAEKLPGKEEDAEAISLGLVKIKGKEGLLIQIGQDRYIVPKKVMPRQLQATFDYQPEAVKVITEKYQKALEALNNNNSLTMEQKVQYKERLDAEYKAQCERAGVTAYRNFISAGFGQLERPSYEVSDNSKKD